MKQKGMFLILLCCAVSFLLSSCASSSGITRQYGNTNGNIVSGGISVQADDWIYFMNYADQNALYRMKTDGTLEEKMADDQAYFLNNVGEWLYFCNGSDGSRIYRMKLDGSEKEAVHTDAASVAFVAGDWIYYINQTDPSNTDEYGKIYKIRTDGSEREKISKNKASTFNLFEDWIYYLSLDDYKLNKVKMDGTENTLISEENIGYMVIYENFIYYMDSTDVENNIRKMDLDGNNSTLLSEDKATALNVSDGWIYYGNTLEDSFDLELKKMKLDGTEVTVVNEDNPINLLIHEDTLVYLDMDFTSFAFKQVITNQNNTVRKEYVVAGTSANPVEMDKFSMNEAVVTDELIVTVKSAYSTNILKEIEGETSPIFDTISDGTFLFAHLLLENHTDMDVKLEQKLGIIENIEDSSSVVMWVSLADITQEANKDTVDFHLPRERFVEAPVLKAKEAMDVQLYIELYETKFPIYLGIYNGTDMTPQESIEIYPNEENYVIGFASSQEIMAKRFPETLVNQLQGLGYKLEGEDKESLYFLFEVKENEKSEPDYYLVRSGNGAIYVGAYNESYPDYPAVPGELLD